jgi:hypothetical protein
MSNDCCKLIPQIFIEIELGPVLKFFQVSPVGNTAVESCCLWLSRTLAPGSAWGAMERVRGMLGRKFQHPYQYHSALPNEASSASTDREQCKVKTSCITGNISLGLLWGVCVCVCVCERRVRPGSCSTKTVQKEFTSGHGVSWKGQSDFQL